MKGVSLSFGKLCHPTAVLSVNREKKNWASADNAVRKASPCLSQPVGAMAKTEPEAAKISAQEYKLCRNHNCSVGYYAVGVQLEKGELRVPVNFKERNYQGPVCYCFNHTVKSIRAEMKIKGHSTARSAVTQEIKAGRCACEIKNPAGSCCLGDVARTVRAAMTELKMTASETAAEN